MTPKAPTKFNIVMERVSGGNVDDYKGKSSDLFKQVYTGLEYMHSKGVIHGDLKFGNVLLREDGKTIVIVDFGKAQDTKKAKSYTYDGAVCYLPPEIVHPTDPRSYQQKPALIEDAPKIDVFSLGVMLFIHSCGGWEKTCQQKPGLHIYEPWTSKKLFGIVAPQKNTLDDLIYKMTHADPKQRISMQDIRKHPRAQAALGIES